MPTQVHSCRFYRRASVPLVVGLGMLLSGCWAPPSAGVRPEGRPGIVASAIEVERVADSATIVSVDRAARTLVLRVRGITLPACRAGRRVRNWRDLESGAVVHATIKEALTVYVAPTSSTAWRSETGPDAEVRSMRRDARVLVADRSYRVLTVQYPNGQTDAFKVGLRTPMKDIEAGDAVVIRPVEIIEAHVRRRSSQEEGSRSRPDMAPAR